MCGPNTLALEVWLHPQKRNYPKHILSRYLEDLRGIYFIIPTIPNTLQIFLLKMIFPGPSWDIWAFVSWGRFFIWWYTRLSGCFLFQPAMDPSKTDYPDPTIRIFFCSKDFSGCYKGLVDSNKITPFLLKKYIPTNHLSQTNHQNHPMVQYFQWEFLAAHHAASLVSEPSRKWDGLPLASFWWKCISGHGDLKFWVAHCGVFYRCYFLRVEKERKDILPGSLT